MPMRVALLGPKGTYGERAAKAMVRLEQLGDADLVACTGLRSVVEHVADPAAYLRACHDLLRPGGLMVCSTLNRNPKSYAVAIIGAEHVMRWLPKGTHEYEKFIKPSELARWVRAAGLNPVEMTGLTYNPLTKRYKLNESDLSVNYMIRASKPG